MMKDAIKNFAKQFEYQPKIENGEKFEQFREFKRFVVGGMGGSHLAADIIKSIDPRLDITVHSSYGIASVRDDEFTDTLFIASSYSGNTEEVLDFFDQAEKKNSALAAIAVGGKLIERARTLNVPYVQMPDTGIQPRSALGFSIKAMLKVMHLRELLDESENLALALKPDSLEVPGKELARKLKDKVPVIYASARNASVAYNWKIKFNETGKIPAYYNVFPELNHNEMTGFDVRDASRALSQNIHFFFISDTADHPKVQRRMEITAQLYRDRGLPVDIIPLIGNSPMERIFISLVIADWAAYYTAENYGLESQQVPMVEEFKKLIEK